MRDAVDLVGGDAGRDGASARVEHLAAELRAPVNNVAHEAQIERESSKLYRAAHAAHETRDLLLLLVQRNDAAVRLLRVLLNQRATCTRMCHLQLTSTWPLVNRSAQFTESLPNRCSA